MSYRITAQLCLELGGDSPVLFRYDQEQGRWTANYLMQGLFTTVRLSLWASILALALGLAMALARTSRILYWQLTARCYIRADAQPAAAGDHLPVLFFWPTS